MYAHLSCTGGFHDASASGIGESFSAIGLGGSLLPGALWAQAHNKTAVSKEMIDDAARTAGVTIPDEYKAMMLENWNDHAKGFDQIFQPHMANSVEPASFRCAL